jgi:hypothetical protein
MDGGSHGLAPMLLRMAFGLNGRPFGRRAQLNLRLLSKAHRTACATYKHILRLTPALQGFQILDQCALVVVR